jgi:hypothetical protein
MTQPAIHLPRSLVNQLLHFAQLSPDQVACGLVSARDGAAIRCYPLGNRAASDLALLNPEECTEALQLMQSRGEQLLAVLYSHPTRPAEPDALEINDPTYPEMPRFIISLNTRGVLELRAFHCGQSGSAAEIELLLTEEPALQPQH